MDSIPASSIPGRMPARDVALAVAVALMWGYNFVPIKLALLEIPPFALAALRFFMAALPAAFFVRRPTAPTWMVAAYGLAIGVGQFGLLFLAIALGMPAGLSSLVIQIQVFLTIALSWVLLGERLVLRHLAGACLAALGIVVLTAHRLAMAEATAAGFVLVVAAAGSWAAGNVLAKKAARRRADMFSFVVWSSLWAPLPLAAASWVHEGGWTAWESVAGMSARGWLAVLFMAYVATLFGFAAWNRLLHRHASAQIAPFALLVPIAGLASSWLWLGENLAVVQVAGAGLVLVGLAVAVLAGGTRKRA